MGTEEEKRPKRLICYSRLEISATRLDKSSFEVTSHGPMPHHRPIISASAHRPSSRLRLSRYPQPPTPQQTAFFFVKKLSIKYPLQDNLPPIPFAACRRMCLCRLLQYFLSSPANVYPSSCMHVRFLALLRSPFLFLRRRAGLLFEWAEW